MESFIKKRVPEGPLRDNTLNVYLCCEAFVAYYFSRKERLINDKLIRFMTEFNHSFPAFIADHAREQPYSIVKFYNTLQDYDMHRFACTFPLPVEPTEYMKNIREKALESWRFFRVNFEERGHFTKSVVPEELHLLL